MKPHHQAILKGLNSVDFTIQTSRSMVDDQLATYIPEVGIRQFLLKNVYWKEKGQLAFRFNVTSLTENNPNIGEALPQHTIFSGKTLFLKGELSNYITPEEHPIIKAHFPNAVIVPINNAGHWLHAENPVDFYNAVMEFLNG